VNYNPLLHSLTQIFDGYTRFDFKGQTLFLRHSCLRDQGNLSFIYNKYYEIAISRGIETEKEIYKRLIESSEWSEEDDLKIAEQESYINNLIKTKDQLFLPSQKEKHEKLIESEQEKLNILLNKKNELVSITAESFASKVCSEEFIRLLIFEDRKLSKLKFTNEEFGDLTIQDLNELNSKHIKINKEINEESIQKIVLQDFFGLYISLCEDPFVFFGKHVHEMSAFQLKLLLYGRVFNNIFQHNDDIPNEIKKDPDEIFKFLDRKKARDKFQSSNSDKDASMVFGATREDLDILDPSARKISLSEQIAKNGGSLNMEDMIKLMGQ
jgi:hypothetical protein